MALCQQQPSHRSALLAGGAGNEGGRRIVHGVSPCKRDPLETRPEWRRALAGDEAALIQFSAKVVGDAAMAARSRPVGPGTSLEPVSPMPPITAISLLDSPGDA